MSKIAYKERFWYYKRESCVLVSIIDISIKFILYYALLAKVRQRYKLLNMFNKYHMYEHIYHSIYSSVTSEVAPHRTVATQRHSQLRLCVSYNLSDCSTPAADDGSMDLHVCLRMRLFHLSCPEFLPKYLWFITYIYVQSSVQDALYIYRLSSGIKWIGFNIKSLSNIVYPLACNCFNTIS